MNRDEKIIRGWLKSGHPPTPEEVDAASRYLLQRLVKGYKKRLAPGRTREERRVERRAKMGSIRQIVMERSNHTCELCGGERATEVHHVGGGSDRRSTEDSTTCIALCWRCHRDAHRGDLSTLGAIGGWAELQGYTVAAQIVERRIAKIRESRASRGEE